MAKSNLWLRLVICGLACFLAAPTLAGGIEVTIVDLCQKRDDKGECDVPLLDRSGNSIGVLHLKSEEGKNTKAFIEKDGVYRFEKGGREHYVSRMNVVMSRSENLLEPRPAKCIEVVRAGRAATGECKR